MTKIVQAEDDVLRHKARPVDRADFGTAELNKIIAEMSAALDAEPDGVAIAAPQIGVSLRIFVVSGKALPRRDGEDQPNQAYINPEIKKMSATRLKMEEGCLSVRYIYGETRRADQVQIEAYNEKGNKFARKGSGLLAQIFQHEIDHLNGILFIDKATHLHRIPAEELENEDD